MKNGGRLVSRKSLRTRRKSTTNDGCPILAFLAKVGNHGFIRLRFSVKLLESSSVLLTLSQRNAKGWATTAFFWSDYAAACC